MLFSVFLLLDPFRQDDQSSAIQQHTFTRLSSHQWPQILVYDAYIFDGRLHRKCVQNLTTSRLVINRFSNRLIITTPGLKFFLSNCLPIPTTNPPSALAQVGFQPFFKSLLPTDLFSPKFGPSQFRVALSPSILLRSLIHQFFPHNGLCSGKAASLINFEIFGLRFYTTSSPVDLTFIKLFPQPCLIRFSIIPVRCGRFKALINHLLL